MRLPDGRRVASSPGHGLWSQRSPPRRAEAEAEAEAVVVVVVIVVVVVSIYLVAVAVAVAVGRGCRGPTRYCTQLCTTLDDEHHAHRIHRSQSGVVTTLGAATRSIWQDSRRCACVDHGDVVRRRQAWPAAAARNFSPRAERRSHEEPMDGVRLEFEHAAAATIGQAARALPAEQLTVE